MPTRTEACLGGAQLAILPEPMILDTCPTIPQAWRRNDNRMGKAHPGIIAQQPWWVVDKRCDFCHNINGPGEGTTNSTIVHPSPSAS